MMRKILIAVIGIFAFLIVGFTPTQAQATGALADGVLTVGMECAYAPYNWTTGVQTDTSQPISGTNSYCDGYDVIVATRLAEMLGVDLEVKAIEWDGLIPSLQSNLIDVIIAGMSPTEERKQTINFTEIYYRSEQVVVVRSNSSYANATSTDDFEGAVVSAQLGTLQEGLLTQLKGADIATALQDYPTLVTALNSKTIDGFIAERPVATQIINNNSGLVMARLTEKGFELDDAQVSTAIGLRKTDTDLQEQLNTALSLISDDQRNEWMDLAIELSSSEEEGEMIPEGFWGGTVFLFKQYAPMFGEGIVYTLIVSLIGTLIGLLLAVFITPLKMLKVTNRDSYPVHLAKRVAVFLSSTYVEVLRGTPMMVQAVIIYYGLAGMNIDLGIHLGLFRIPGIIVTGILIVSINTSAYIVEVLRGSIEAIDKGQMEAARSLGMTRAQVMRLIIIPQAIKNSIPSIGNEFVINIKDTSVLSVISVTELFFMTRKVNAIYYRQTEGFVIAAVIYLILTFTTTRLLYLVSRKLNHSQTISIPTSQSFFKRVIKNER